MTRVTENSSTATIKFALNKAKGKLEDLQLKGATLKDISKPSDNPISNVEALGITSATNDNMQFLKNADFALLNLNVTEKSLEEITNILTKAKELAISQASDFFNEDVRKNVANEVDQLYNQSLAVANKKIGIKFIFSGTNTLEPPFTSEGNYKGNDDTIKLEIARNFFVPINLSGSEVFYGKSTDKSDNASEYNIFADISTLSSALKNNQPEIIQGLLEKFDNSISRIITLRTRIGSISNSVDSSKNTIEKENVENAERKSHLLDTDVAELFSNIQKEQAMLKTTYQSTQGLLSQTLMDYIRR